MQIRKATEAVSSGVPTAVQLEAINVQAKAQLTAEQVYVFSLRLCDDQTPRLWRALPNCSWARPALWITAGVRRTRWPGFLRPRW